MAQVYRKGENVCITRTIIGQGWKDMPLSEYDITAYIYTFEGEQKFEFHNDDEEMIVDDATDTITILLSEDKTKDMSGMYFCRCMIEYNGQEIYTNNIEVAEII